jgi:hypothetical protein
MEDKIEKNKLKKKNQADPGEPFKPELISQTRNSLNFNFSLNQETQHLIN